MSSIIELSDIEEYNAEDFADVAKIVNKDKDRDDINEDKSKDDENDGTVAFFTSKLQVPKIIYTTVPVEYPETSLEGVNNIQCHAFSDVVLQILKSVLFLVEYQLKKIKECARALITDQEFVNQEHCSIDFDSETFKKYTQQQDINSKEAKTYILFLAVNESSCPFKKENISCDGRAHIGRMTNY
ncbi:unnamed protein product [Rhizophagus irregularis]|nr:unnamed protein product [Rhizophagus irregularis]CAB5376408.1 unnamed protein product [Rhizophagus irregularis]